MHYTFLRIASVENVVFFSASRDFNFSQESVTLVGVEDVFLIVSRKLELQRVSLSKIMDIFNIV